MYRIDIARLRKDHGMSQRILAEHLQIKQSFLSAIENGKSPLPTNKRQRLAEIFGDVDLHDYYVDTDTQPDIEQVPDVARNEASMLTQLLNYFHTQAHKESDKEHVAMHARVDTMQQRIDSLVERNEVLQEKLDMLRVEIDTLKTENFRLKEIILTNGIKY